MQPLSRTKTINDQRVRGISPVAIDPKHLRSADTGDIIRAKDDDNTGDEEFCGRRPTHLEQFASCPSNRNALASDVRPTSQEPPVWLTDSASEDYLGRALQICALSSSSSTELAIMDKTNWRQVRKCTLDTDGKWFKELMMMMMMWSSAVFSSTACNTLLYCSPSTQQTRAHANIPGMQ